MQPKKNLFIHSLGLVRNAILVACNSSVSCGPHCLLSMALRGDLDKCCECNKAVANLRIPHHDAAAYIVDLTALAADFA